MIAIPATQSDINPRRPAPALQKIAIQGVPGAFHDLAARQFFGENEMELAPAHTFRQLFNLVENGHADQGLMAIENTIAGSIIGNYRLLVDSSLRATGEVYLRIVQNLMALPGQRIEDLTEVHSHPMAIAQCADFFEAYPHIRLVETEDTALSAQRIFTQKLTGIGAIASRLAAEMYSLELLAEGIETNKRNYTRFLVLQRRAENLPSDAEKVMLFFSLAHEVGSLHRVLGAMSAHGANLTKIQSIPIAGRPWEYYFFVDFVTELTGDWQAAVEAIRPFTSRLEVLGAFAAGKFFDR